MVELYINDKLVQLIGGESITVDYAIFDIAKISTRDGVRGYEFDLPKTNINKSILESPDIVNNLSVLPYTKAKARCYINGIDTLIRFCELRSVKDVFKVRLYGGNADIFSFLRDLKLRDLDLSAFDHFWKFRNVVDSRLRGVSGLYTYPIIDLHTDLPTDVVYTNAKVTYTAISGPSQFQVGEVVLMDDGAAAGTVIDDDGSTVYIINTTGFYNPTHTMTGQFTSKKVTIVTVGVYGNIVIDNVNRVIRTDYQLPFFYVDYLLNKIITDAGYNFVNEAEDFINDSGLMVVSPTDIARNDNGNRYNASWKLTGLIGLGMELPLNHVTLISSEGQYYNASDSNLWQSLIHFDDKVRLHVKLHLYLSNSTGSPVPINFICRVSTETGTFDHLITATVPAGLYRLIDIDFGFVDVEKSTAFGFSFLELYAFSFGSAVIENIATGAPADSSLSFTEASILETYDTVYGGYLTMNSMLPDLTQLEFITAYLQQFFLIVVKNDITNTISFVSFEKILENVGKAYDWSAKVDYSEDPEITFELDQYGKENHFNYKDEEGEIKPVGTDGILGLSNPSVDTGEVVSVELPYSASQEVLRLINIPMNQIGLFDKGEYQGNKNPRVLMLEKLNASDLEGGTGVTYAEAAGGQSELVTDNLPLTWFIRSGKALNLGFGDNLIPLYYRTIGNVLNNVKVVDLLVRLNASHINQLDPTIPVWVDKFESYFYINKIRAFDYTQTKSTVVELVKLNL